MKVLGTKMKTAIIGSGISGLGAACILHPHHDIVIYEKAPYIGGHSRTIDVTAKGKTVPVDTGFIVYNERNYPHLTAMFGHYGVKTHKSDMSFGASIANGAIEYGSKNMFGQRRNILRPAFLKMVADILRFNRTVHHYLNDTRPMTLGECLKEMKMGDWFCQYYLQAMGAAIWSCSVETILNYPAQSFLRFFDNHGLLTIKSHPQWYTVTGGSREYIKTITKPFADKIRLNCGVTRVIRRDHNVTVIDQMGRAEDFDIVVFACHADQALMMIEQPSGQERGVLGAFSYQKNSIIVHGDKTFMPKTRSCWASWIYRSEAMDDKNESVSLTYWMNNLQGIEASVPVFVTLNSARRPQDELIYDEYVFDHPVFTLDAVAAQGKIDSVQGQNRSYFCGAYQRYGFHEDGLMSAVNAMAHLGLTPPWDVRR